MIPSSLPLCDLPVPPEGSLFERVGWFYAFLRRRVFRNDTAAIARALHLARMPTDDREDSPVLLEVGCGPGFYACTLAGRFPRWTVRGLDRSTVQLRLARESARRAGLSNCAFTPGDATALKDADASVDGVFASRLFTVLTDDQPAAVLSEMHRVLRPGGRYFLAEPRLRWRAAIPLRLLWLLARLTPGAPAREEKCREPRRPTVLAADAFRTLVASQPWAEILCWEDGAYQYALARKRTDSPAPGGWSRAGGGDIAWR